MGRRHQPNVLGRRRRPLAARLVAWRRRRTPWVAVAVAGAAAALAGLTTSDADPGDKRPAPVREPSASRVVTSNDVAVRVPTGWSTNGSLPTPPGTSLADPIRLVNTSSDVRVLIGIQRANSGTLLPSEFLSGLTRTLPKPERVRIGGELVAWHYAGVWHERVAVPLDVYVAPSTEGVVTAMCLAKAVVSLLDGCWSVVSKISLVDGQPAALGPAAGFRDALVVRVTRIDAVNAAARRALARAQSPAQQAGAVSELPAVYDEAAAALAPLAPKDLAVAHEIVATLRQTGDAYEVLARSLRQADPVAYARAKSVARARRDRLTRLLDGILYSKS